MTCSTYFLNFFEGCFSSGKIILIYEINRGHHCFIEACRKLHELLLLFVVFMRPGFLQIRYHRLNLISLRLCSSCISFI